MAFKKTKIVCTIGPSSWHPAILEQLVTSGMDAARLNFSHGTHQEKQDQIKKIRQISRKFDRPLAIIADLQGPKIRLGEIEGEVLLKTGQSISLSVLPIEQEIPIQFDLSPYLKKGQRLLLNDGLVSVRVTSVVGKLIRGIVQNDGVISAHKGVNVPDTKLPNVSLTEKDIVDLEFALGEDVDYIALSFVQSASDLKKARELIKKYQSRAKIIVKLEKPQAVENLEAIIRSTDVIMVARGDLAIETKAATVPLIQKRIIRLARQYFKPVIVATQMLESMTENPRPTRAEVSDVANATFDSVDAVMLSGETAAGKYPVESVKMMQEIITSVESHEEYCNNIGIDTDEISGEQITSRALASAAAVLAEIAQIKVIFVGTSTGKSAQSLSSFRPVSQIIAVTHDQQTKNQLALLWGVASFVVEPEEIESFWKKSIQLARKQKIVQRGDQVVLMSGPFIGVAGQTDTIRLVKV